MIIRSRKNDLYRSGCHPSGGGVVRTRIARRYLSVGCALSLGMLLMSSAAIAQTQSASLSGTLFNDLNGDGSSNGNTDPPLGGWSVNLLDSSSNVVATATSDGSGLYTFPTIAPGAYSVEEILPGGWTLTTAADLPFTAVAGGVLTGFDFGNFQLVSVSGNIYNDLNNSGSQNGGEPGLKGWTAEVRDASNTVVASAVSDANGNYTIHNVGPGTFTLDEVVQNGWVTTQPTNPTYYSFTSSSGVNVVGGIFGNHRTTAVPEPDAGAALLSALTSGALLLMRRTRRRPRI